MREEHEALTIARIDPASEIAEGDEAELWLDTSRVHYFDPESGENLVPVEDREPVGATSSSSSADGAPGSFAVVPDERVGRPLEHADGAVPLVERRALPAPVRVRSPGVRVASRVRWPTATRSMRRYRSAPTETAGRRSSARAVPAGRTRDRVRRRRRRRARGSRRSPSRESRTCRPCRLRGTRADRAGDASATIVSIRAARRQQPEDLLVRCLDANVEDHG